MNIKEFIIKVFRKVYRKFFKNNITTEHCQYIGQRGNDKILEVLNDYQEGGLMLSKWGTVELSDAVYTYLVRHVVNKFILLWDTITDKYSAFEKDRCLANQAGVFPANKNEAE